MSLREKSNGLYDAICKEIGRLIEAVRPVAAADVALGSKRPLVSGDDESFTARIERLVRQNNQLRAEVDRLQHKVTEVTDISEGWKMRCTQLDKDLLREQGIVCSLEEELSDLQRHVHEAVQSSRQRRIRQVNGEDTALAPTDDDRN
ncbi:hypothetical protein ASPFODRAFT_55001 [Aspergillus luchuensis CBS 106.47]|uniref:Autophagy-related protein 16 domain-containing protein n=1 Tax=Aspergillus luchuensis (strain CBS 106.47) TaxID=1137211 RepID=A0A1M3SYH8_ASPLC|nr:hypothetical protein ASPFODRAFT_55001 [Aspergillus luchuensis CBS 106.47]